MNKLGKLFNSHIDELSLECYQKRLMQTAISFGAVCSVGAALIAPNQPKQQLGWQLFLGSALGFTSAYINQSRRDVEARFKSFTEMNREQFKSNIKNEFKMASAQTDIMGELKLAQFIRTLPPSAQERYSLRFQLEGLGLGGRVIEDSEELSNQGGSQSFQGRANNLASPNLEIKEQIIDKDNKAILKNLSSQYPKLLRTDGEWVQELIVSSSNPIMSKRLNHHFYICGETQSGKSTLAGVIAEGIASLSQSPSVIAIHDAKKEPGGLDITSWLCGWTEGYKIDGLAATEQWYSLASRLSQEQTKEVSKIGSSCEGVRELILIQDEVDSIFGKGKGFGEIIPKKLAERMQTFWMYSIKYLAGLRGHMIFMGQSPLSEDTGFNRPSLSNLCFICLGQTTDYILNNPKDFLKHMTEEEINLLKQFCKLFEDMGVRYALVRPMKGSAYVAIIPHFAKKENEISPLVVENEDEKISELSSEIQDTPKNSTQESSNQGGSNKEIYEALVEWCLLLKEEIGHFPSPSDIQSAYKEATGNDLDLSIAENIVYLARKQG